MAVRADTGADRAPRSVVDADVDLAHSLDRSPDADEAGLHRETVAGAVGLRLTALDRKSVV